MVSNETKGTFLVFLTALESGLAIIVNRYFVTKIDPLIFTVIRAFFIGLVFLIISLLQSNFNLKKFKRVSWKYLLAIGIIGGGIAFLLFFTGLKMTTGGRAAFLHKTLPLWASLLAFLFLKEKITREQLIAMFTMLLGLSLMEYDNIPVDIRLGDLLVLLATILWAIENTIARKAMLLKETNWVVTFSRMFFGSLVLFSIMFLVGKINLLFELTHQQIVYITVSAAMLTWYVLTWYWGLRYINLSKASTILLLSPVISLVAGYYFLNEPIFKLQIAGSMLILVGAYHIIKVKSERRIMEVE
mgnify:FL=1